MSISGRQKDQLARNELPRSNYAEALAEKRNSPRLRQVLSRLRSPAAEQIVAKQMADFFVTSGRGIIRSLSAGHASSQVLSPFRHPTGLGRFRFVSYLEQLVSFMATARR